MTYAFIQDVPADREMYAKIRAKLPTAAPAGLITHVVIEQESGLRYVDVWATEAGLDPVPRRLRRACRHGGARELRAPPRSLDRDLQRRHGDRHLDRRAHFRLRSVGFGRSRINPP